MKRKNLLLTVAASAVLGAFNPAFAGGGAKHGSADDVSSSPRAEQGLPGTQSGPAVESANMNPDASAGTSASAGAEQGQPGTQSGPAVESAEMNSGASGNIGPQASIERGQDVDPRTGLDRSHPAN